MAKTSGLGRGFDALLPTNFDNSLLAAEGEKIQKIAVGDIIANPNQPRREFDATALAGLAASIKRYGIMQPIVVAPGKANQYEIIAGERRWRAAKQAGLQQLPAIVRSSKEQERLELALIENVQRVDLSPLEEAASIEYLHSQFNLSYEAIAERLSKGLSTVTNLVRLLQLPPAAAQALGDGKISEGHARAVLSLRDYPDHQTELLQQIINQGWSVRQAERYVVGIKQGHVAKAAAHARVATQTPATQALSQRLSAPVQIKRMAKGGRLEIAFKSDDELAKIISQLS